MIACDLYLFRQAREQRLRRIDRDLALFAVHELLRVLDTAAECLADSLMAEAHAEDRNASAELCHDLLADAGVLRIAGTRREDDV